MNNQTTSATDCHTSATNLRIELLDALRGLAVVFMMVFHFCFDLTQFGWTQSNFYTDPFWLNARVLIVSLFVSIAGMSFSLANAPNIHWQSFFRRNATLLANTLLVSAGSYLMFPQSWIFFGILHFMLVASLLGLVFLRLGYSNAIIGVGIVLFSLVFSYPLFDTPALQWVGLMTHKPITEDYAPLLPWFGVFLIGMAIGTYLVRNSCALRQSLPPSVTPLLRLGKHSLLVYMLHQPLFIGGMIAVMYLC